ncbi:unnamed protein product [Hymenolepis diminuta]|uniref:Uncharacterized protein n=1 Tax=Hymenolepis diminuta TaxID=6216 RepID=A0A564YJL9_HYMDI|nr:unnamed protein product [Hymenolepis diminuta]
MHRRYLTPKSVNAKFNPQPLLLTNLTPRNLGTPLVPNWPPPPDWQMGGQSTMVDGGLLEFCLPPPYQSQFMPVRPLSLGLEPFWAANGSIVFVDQTTKTFYTPEQVNEIFRHILPPPTPLLPINPTFQVPMQLVSRQLQVPTVFSLATDVLPIQHLFGQHSSSPYSVPNRILQRNRKNWHH